MKLTKLAKILALTAMVGVSSISAYALGPAASVANGYVCTHSGGTLNMRSGAGQNFKVVAKLKHGTDVSVIDSRAARDGMEWYKVRAGKSVGWVRYDYVCGL